MRIESVDLFYLSMPEMLDIGDGSQDALLFGDTAEETFAKARALANASSPLQPGTDGLLAAPDGPGSGMTVDYEIRMRGKVLYATPELGE